MHRQHLATAGAVATACACTAMGETPLPVLSVDMRTISSKVTLMQGTTPEEATLDRLATEEDGVKATTEDTTTEDSATTVAEEAASGVDLRLPRLRDATFRPATPP